MQGWLSGPIDPFTPAAGPAHPIVFQLAEGGWGLRLQVLLLAAVLAPLVEETMFRGVLYRHLREVSGRFGRPLSVLISATLNTLIFAGVHPQGWVAVPALMGLAYGFVLLREWRGSLLPAMVAHGLSNGLVMTMLILLLSN